MSFLVSLGLLCGFVLPASATELPANPFIHTCVADLRSGDPAFRLAIGVLAETTDGSLILGTSPYAGSVHSAIAAAIIANTEVKQILWMGEGRLVIANGKPLFSEVNETSGYYADTRFVGIKVGERSISVLNSVEVIPLANRAENFKGHKYDAKNKRLAKELQNIPGDVRHTIGNSLQVVSSIAKLVNSKRSSTAEKYAMASSLRVRNAADLTLVRWLVLNLYEESRIEEADAITMNSLLTALSRHLPVIAELEAIDLEALDLVMQKLSRIINPNLGGMRVDLYKLR